MTPFPSGKGPVCLTGKAGSIPVGVANLMFIRLDTRASYV